VRRKRCLSILTYMFLCFFAVYAVSPLTYSLPNSTSPETRTDTDRAPNTIRLFLIDVLFSTLSQQNDDEEDGPADDHSHVLLVKNRTLRSSNSKIIAEPVANLAKHFEMPPVREQALLARTVFEKGPTCPRGYQLLHSGISPPSA